MFPQKNNQNTGKKTPKLTTSDLWESTNGIKQTENLNLWRTAWSVAFPLGSLPIPFQVPLLPHLRGAAWSTEYKPRLDLNYKTHAVTVNIPTKLHCQGGI